MIGTSFDLRSIAAYIVDEMWRQRWLIVFVTWVICLIGWAAVIAMPDRYAVSARLYVDTETVLMPLMRGIAVQSDLAKIIDIMRRTLLSRPNIERLLRMADLDITLNSDLEREEMIASLQKRISVETGLSSAQLYTVSFEDKNPQLAQKVVESLLTIFVEQNVGNKRRDVEGAQRFINAQIADYEGRLRSAEAQLAQFRQTHAQELGSRQSAAAELQNAESDIRRLETDRQALIWRRDQLRLELSRAPEFLSVEEARNIAAVQSPAAERVAGLRSSLSNLLLTKTERHPEVIAVRRQLENAETDLAKQGGPKVNAAGRVANPTHLRLSEELKRLDTDIAVADRRLDTARTILADQRKRIESMPEVEQQMTQLNRDYDILRKNYEELVGRRESARMAQSMESSTKSVDFRVIDPPVVPLAPTGPNRILFFSGVLAAALAISVGLMLLQYLIRDPLINTTQLHELSELPVLGGVSRVSMPWHINTFELLAMTVLIGSLFTLFGSMLYLYKFTAIRPDLADLAMRLSDLTAPWVESLIRFAHQFKAGL